MANIKLDDNEYKMIIDYRDGYNEEALKEKYTEYFYPFDYILGDWAYGKLRLKGFYKKGHKSCRSINNYENVEKYLKESCAYDCRHFILEKSKGKALEKD